LLPCPALCLALALLGLAQSLPRRHFHRTNQRSPTHRRAPSRRRLPAKHGERPKFLTASQVLEFGSAASGASGEFPCRARPWGTRPPDPLGFTASSRRHPSGKPACPPSYGAAGGPKAENPGGWGARPPHACPPEPRPEPQELGTLSGLCIGLIPTPNGPGCHIRRHEGRAEWREGPGASRTAERLMVDQRPRAGGPVWEKRPGMHPDRQNAHSVSNIRRAVDTLWEKRPRKRPDRQNTHSMPGLRLTQYGGTAPDASGSPKRP